MIAWWLVLGQLKKKIKEGRMKKGVDKGTLGKGRIKENRVKNIQSDHLNQYQHSGV